MNRSELEWAAEAAKHRRRAELYQAFGIFVGILACLAGAGYKLLRDVTVWTNEARIEKLEQRQ